MKTALRILLVAVLVYSYWIYVHVALSRPSLADYERATAYIRARFQAGDLVDVAPFWAERVREYLGDLPRGRRGRPVAALRHWPLRAHGRRPGIALRYTRSNTNPSASRARSLGSRSPRMRGMFMSVRSSDSA